jgi:hypothetical protein
VFAALTAFYQNQPWAQRTLDLKKVRVFVDFLAETWGK